MNCCRTCQALCKTFPYGENMEGIIVRKIAFRFTAIKAWAENGSPELLEPGFLRHPRSLRCAIRPLNPALSAEMAQPPAQAPLIMAHFAICSHTPRRLTFSTNSDPVPSAQTENKRQINVKIPLSVNWMDAQD